MPESTFRPAWWVPGPHAQTIWGKFFRRTHLPPGTLRRYATDDGDFIEVFEIEAAPTAPRLVLLHGLEGTLRSHYAQGILERAYALGWGADFLLFRGCGPTDNVAPRFYHSGDTADLACLVRAIVSERPQAPLVFAGYSLGGNVLLKWLGERSSDVPSTAVAAMAMSVPYQLAASAERISRGFSRVYEMHFLRTLRAKALAKLARYPGLFDAGALASAKTLADFDDAVTAPVHGFASAQDYYQRSSSIQFLSAISVRTLLLSAYDDPFLPGEVLTDVAQIARGNPALEAEFYPHGGHVGFVSGRAPWHARYFAEDRVMAFFCHQLGVKASHSSAWPGQR